MNASSIAPRVHTHTTFAGVDVAPVIANRWKSAKRARRKCAIQRFAFLRVSHALSMDNFAYIQLFPGTPNKTYSFTLLFFFFALWRVASKTNWRGPGDEKFSSNFYYFQHWWFPRDQLSAQWFICARLVHCIWLINCLRIRSKKAVV